MNIKRIIKTLPIPFSGVMLSLAALGNLLKTINEDLRLFLGVLSLVIFFLLTIKSIFDFEQIKNGFNNPVIAGVMSTFPMTMMILSTYLVKFNLAIARFFFTGGILIHLLIIVMFTKNYVLKFDLNNFYPTNFIVYTGIVCGSVASPALGLQHIGQILFWIGLIGLIIMYPLVTKRVVKKSLPSLISPIIAIYTAPASLCLAGYISAYGVKGSFVFFGLLIFASINFIFILTKLPKSLGINFNPSYSALTFPFVITAIAIKMSEISSIYSSFTQIIAVVLVSYVFMLFIKAIITEIFQKDLVASEI